MRDAALGTLLTKAFAAECPVPAKADSPENAICQE
jgi:hypothetical protein